MRTAHRLRPVPLSGVWCSDLSRTLDTARAIAECHSLEVTATPRLREIMLGDWEGLTAEEIVARGDGELFRLYRLDPYRNRPPASEPMDAVFARVRTVLDDIRNSVGEGTVAIVGHGGSLRAILCDAICAPAAAMRHFALYNGSVSVVEERRSAGARMSRLLLLNDTSHLAESPAT